MDIFFTKFEEIYAKSLRVYGEPQRKRNICDITTLYRRIFKEIVDNIENEISDRYREIRQLNFFRILDPDCFEMFTSKFSEEIFNELKIRYETKFDFDRLKNELHCLYSSPEFKGMNVYEIIQFCHEKKCVKCFLK